MRSADETEKLSWAQLEDGDAIRVRFEGETRIGRVHKRHAQVTDGETIGVWVRDDEEFQRVRQEKKWWFGTFKTYSKSDACWTKLTGITLPGGKDYVVGSTVPKGTWNGKCRACGRGTYVGFLKVEHEGGTCPQA